MKWKWLQTTPTESSSKFYCALKWAGQGSKLFKFAALSSQPDAHLGFLRSANIQSIRDGMVIENNNGNNNNNKDFISVEHLFILVTQVLNIL